MLFQGSLDECMKDFQNKRALELYEDFRGLLSAISFHSDSYPYRRIK